MSFSRCHLFGGVWSSPADAQCSPALENCTLEGAFGKGRKKLKENLKSYCQQKLRLSRLTKREDRGTLYEVVPEVRHCYCQQTRQRWSPWQGPLQIDQCSLSPSAELKLDPAGQHCQEPEIHRLEHLLLHHHQVRAKAEKAKHTQSIVDGDNDHLPAKYENTQCFYATHLSSRC